MDKQRRLELEAGGTPATYREIMFQALSPAVHPQRSKLTDEADLKRLDLTPNELVQMLAKALKEQYGSNIDHLEEDGEKFVDIDSELKEGAVTRILENKSGLTELIRSHLAKDRQAQIEDQAREMLRTGTTQEHPYEPEEAAAAVTKILWKTRNDLAGSFGRTIKECAEILNALVRAYLDRTYCRPQQALPPMPEDEARRRGPAASEMFYRAVDPSVGDAEIASVQGLALAALPALDKERREPQNLANQLASADYLQAGQEEQVEAETAARRHFPFGLQGRGSLAVLAAAIYLVRAQCSDTIVRAAQPPQLTNPNPAALFMPTVNALNDTVKKKAEADGKRGWTVAFSTTPGALDCLRAASPMLSAQDVPLFLRVPPPRRPFANKADPAHWIVYSALPLNEQPKEAKESWIAAHWNPFGQQLLHKVNKEHYKLDNNNLLFHDEEFESVAAQHATDVLTELIKRLQRAEGVSVGLPNTRKIYTHSTVLSLNKFLATVSSTLFTPTFKNYRTALLNRGMDVRKGTPAKTAPVLPVADFQGDLPQGLPQGVVLLTLDSVRVAMEKLLVSVSERQWAYTEQFSDPGALSAETVRAAAVEMLEVANWAEFNKVLLRDMSLGDILSEYHLHQGRLGNPPPEPDEVVLLRELILDTVLTDATVRRILAGLGTTSEDPCELSKDTDQ